MNDAKDFELGEANLSKSELDNIEVAINNYNEYKDILSKRMKYKEDSILLSLDNSCVPTLERKYLISDYYELEFPKVGKSNYIDNIIALYRSAVVSSDSIMRIKKNIGWKCNDLYIKELINVGLLGNSILQVKVMAPSKEDCSNIMSVVDDIISEATGEINRSFNYDFDYLSESYSEEYNEEITKNKKFLVDDILAIENSIAGIPANMSEKEKSIYFQLITDKVEEPIKSSPMKKFVLGIIVGSFLALFVLIANYVISDRLKTTNELISVFKCPVLEVIDDPKREFGNDLFGKFDKKLDEFLYHRKSYNDTLSLSASRIKLGIGESSNVLLTNSYDSVCNDNPVIDLVARVKNLASSSEDFAVEYVNRVIKNTMEIEKIGNMDCAVIIERLGESRYEDINKTIELLKKSRIELLGAVVIR